MPIGFVTVGEGAVGVELVRGLHANRAKVEEFGEVQEVKLHSKRVGKM